MNRASLAWITRGLLGSAFVALVYRANSGVAGYLWRRPASFDGSSALSALRHSALPLASAAGCCVLFSSAGAMLLRKMKDPSPRIPEAFALGAGSCAAFLLLLGLVSHLGPIEAAVLLLLAALAGSTTAFPRMRGPDALDSFPRAIRSALAVVLGYALWHGGATALAPPTDADALAYHLALPKLYASVGRIRDVPWMIFSHWPHLPQVLYSIGIFARMETLPALLHFATAAALVLSVFNAGRDWLSERAAWLAAALLAAQPILAGFAGTPRIEAWWALFAFLASVYAWRWKQDGAKSYIVLSGLFAGFAASSKLMGLASLCILAAWTALQGRGTMRGPALRAAGWFLMAGLAVVLPWYLKTWIALGNPIWPFFSKVLGGSAGAELVEAPFLAVNRWPSPMNFSRLLGNGPQYMVVPLAVSTAGWFCIRREQLPPFLSFLWLTFLPYIPFVVWNYEAWRYLVPGLPAMALTTGWCCASLSRENGAGRWIGTGAAAFGLSGVLLLSQNNALFAVLELHSASAPGRPARELYLERADPAYAFFRRVNERLKVSSGLEPKVLLINENYGYLLDVPYQWGSPHYQGLISYGAFVDGHALVVELRRMGITHILISLDASAMAPLTPRARSVLVDAFSRCDEVLESDDYHLYRLGAA